jgi:hypothetical protein
MFIKKLHVFYGRRLQVIFEYFITIIIWTILRGPIYCISKLKNVDANFDKMIWLKRI